MENWMKVHLKGLIQQNFGESRSLCVQMTRKVSTVKADSTEKQVFDWLEEIIAPAIDAVYRDPSDKNLLDRGVNERTLVSNIFFKANTLLKEFQSKQRVSNVLHMDIEYNRNYQDPKFLFTDCSSCELDCENRTRGHEQCSSPDLIIHKRNSNDHNSVVIEFKKLDNQSLQSRQYDKAKLIYFTCQTAKAYRFEVGYFIDLGPNYYCVTTIHDASLQQTMFRHDGEWCEPNPVTSNIIKLAAH